MALQGTNLRAIAVAASNPVEILHTLVSICVMSVYWQVWLFTSSTCRHTNTQCIYVYGLTYTIVSLSLLGKWFLLSSCSYSYTAIAVPSCSYCWACGKVGIWEKSKPERKSKRAKNMAQIFPARYLARGLQLSLEVMVHQHVGYVVYTVGQVSHSA